MDRVLKILSERKSVRVFTGERIPEETAEMILEASSRAPTAGNQQLYTVLRITDAGKKHALSVSCDHQPFIEQADLVLVFCADCLKWYNAFSCAGCSPRKPEAGDLMLAVSDACIAAQNAVIAAEALGIGSCYIGDIMENAEKQREILSLPEYVFPAAMVVFGYPTQRQKERERTPRFARKYIVRENTYHVLSEEETREMFRERAGGEGFEKWMRAFCERKYESDFSREMSRSVRKYLEDFEPAFKSGGDEG